MCTSITHLLDQHLFTLDEFGFVGRCQQVEGLPLQLDPDLTVPLRRNADQNLTHVTYRVVFAGPRAHLSSIQSAEDPRGEHARSDAHDRGNHQCGKRRGQSQKVQQTADQAKRQGSEDPEAQGEEDRQKPVIDFAVAARMMGVDVVVDPGRAIRVSVTAHQQLHHDGAETEDQSREVQHSHAAKGSSKGRQRPQETQNQLRAGRALLAFGP